MCPKAVRFFNATAVTHCTSTFTAQMGRHTGCVSGAELPLMSDAVTLYPGGVVPPAQQRAFVTLDSTMSEALVEAKNAGVPQGLIVALLHGLAAHETNIMTGD